MMESVLKLGIGDRKWLLVFAGSVFFVAYMPPVDLAKKIEDWNNDCFLPIVLIPLIIALFLLLLYFSEKWKQWKRLLFVYALPVAILVYLLFESFSCFRQFSDLLITEDTVEETAPEQNEEKCACYLAGKTKEVIKVKYIPAPVKSQPPIYNLTINYNNPQVNLRKDTVVYNVTFYRPPVFMNSFLYSGLFYSISPELRSRYPVPYSKYLLDGFKYRMNIMSRVLGKYFFHINNFNLFNENEVAIDEGVSNGVGKFARLARWQAYNSTSNQPTMDLEKIAEITDFAEFLDKVERAYHDFEEGVKNEVFDFEDIPGEDLFLDTFGIIKPFLDSIANLNTEIATTGGSNGSENLTLQQRKIIAEYYDLKNDVRYHEMVQNECIKQLKERDTEIKTLKAQLEKRDANSQMNLLNPEFDGENRIVQVKGPIATYSFKGKSVLVENNSTHTLRQIEGFSVAFDPGLLKVIGEDAVLYIAYNDSREALYEKRVNCNDDPCKMDIPDYVFSNNKSLRGNRCRVYLRGTSQIDLVTFGLD